MGWLDKLFGRSNAPDPAETFGRPVARALHEAGFPNPIAFDPEKFEITLGEDRTLDLQNYYQDFLADDSDFDSVFERIKATLDSESMVPKTFEEARPNLIPVIREKVYLDRSGCGAIGTADEPGAIPRKTLNQDLAVTVIWNGEEAFFTQTFRGYEAWGVDFDEAYAAAMENLKR
jgi:hypothetical protein